MQTIFNTITKEKEIFKTIKDKHINLYVCGVTVYDFCHIGHARAMIIFDVFVRYFQSQGYTVNYVRNITDVDDKIINRAKERNQSIDEITDFFIQAMHDDQKELGLLAPNREPRATEYISHMIQMIETLIQKGFAYVGQNGDVYYKISEFKEYGKLSHKEVEHLRAGARVEINESKNDPLDFVLWKLVKPSEPAWDSPWGEGRPGWHIECSAMSTDCLGNHFDIHGGGLDLQFPHHENEIAQSEAATGEIFANYWMHVGLVQVNNEKMAKSLGNFTTIREVLKQHDAEVIRYFMISNHYRSPVNFSDDSLAQARASLDRLYNALMDYSDDSEELFNEDYEKQFLTAMQDDLNTPIALSVLFEIAHEIQREKNQNTKRAQSLMKLLKKLGSCLGILNENANMRQQQGFSNDDVQRIENLIQQRNLARQEKNWQRSDEIRDQLTAEGIVLEDGTSATGWRRS